jgi:ribosomal protein S18 acetylase RimI-like enzyme
MELEIRSIGPADRPAADAFLCRFWGETRVIAVAGVFNISVLPGAVALRGGQTCGAAVWNPEPDLLRIVAIAASPQRMGTGRALLGAAEAAARAAGLRRIVLGTVNSNLRALGFYQRNGYVLTALHPGAVAGFRAIKPSIPLVDDHSIPPGLPIRDQIDLEKRLD